MMDPLWCFVVVLVGTNIYALWLIRGILALSKRVINRNEELQATVQEQEQAIAKKDKLIDDFRVFCATQGVVVLDQSALKG